MINQCVTLKEYVVVGIYKILSRGWEQDATPFVSLPEVAFTWKLSARLQPSYNLLSVAVVPQGVTWPHLDADDALQFPFSHISPKPLELFPFSESMWQSGNDIAPKMRKSGVQFPVQVMHGSIDKLFLQRYLCPPCINGYLVK